MYLANYDPSTGKILGFYINGMHSDIPQPIFDLTKEQHQEYFDKGQNYKIINNIFTYIEPIKQTQSEIKENNLFKLDNEYQPKFLEITRSWSNANMDGNAELMKQKQIEKQNLIKEYNNKREVILNG